MTDQLSDLVARADVCVVAMAECFRGDGEILANPIGTIPMIGGRLARATFEPDLAMTDGEARLIANDEAFEWPDGKVVETLQPVPADVRVGVERAPPRRDGRHADRPVRQPELRRHRRLPAAEGAAPRLPRRTRQHDQRHDVVLGAEPLAQRAVRGRRHRVRRRVRPGRRSSASASGRFHEIRYVVTNLAVLDFATPDHRLRLRSVHPGVTPDEVQDATGFDLVVPDDVPQSRLPTPDELELIATVIDPAGHRFTEVPRELDGGSRAATEPKPGRSSITQMTGPPEGPPPPCTSSASPSAPDRRGLLVGRHARRRHHRGHRRRPRRPQAPQRRPAVLLPIRRPVPLHAHAHPPPCGAHRRPLHLRRHRQGGRHVRHPGGAGRRGRRSVLPGPRTTSASGSRAPATPRASGRSQYDADGNPLPDLSTPDPDDVLHAPFDNSGGPDGTADGRPVWITGTPAHASRLQRLHRHQELERHRRRAPRRAGDRRADRTSSPRRATSTRFTQKQLVKELVADRGLRHRGPPGRRRTAEAHAA